MAVVRKERLMMRNRMVLFGGTTYGTTEDSTLTYAGVLMSGEGGSLASLHGSL